MLDRKISTDAEVCWQHSFNGKPQVPVIYWLADAGGLPLNDETSSSLLSSHSFAEFLSVHNVVAR